MFAEEAVWLELIERQISWKGSEKMKDVSKYAPTYLMIPLSHKFDNITIEVLGLEETDWLFACTPSVVTRNFRRWLVQHFS